ncbi:hypothetical protein N9X02_11775 [Planktomarina temperata]|nr:hypothetical protein [Planktomarina temperata]
MKRLFFIIVIMYAIVGCVKVESNVESYSSLDNTALGASVFVAPTKGQATNTLSWAKNKSLLEQELKSSGLKVVSSPKRADYLAYFGFAVDTGQLVTTNYSIPQYGVTGYSGANTYGSVYGNSYSSTTTLNPTYGVTGYSSGSTTNKIFTRSAKLFLQNRKSKEIVFEGNAVSSGSCHSFAPVAPYIIKSILTNFPDGKVGRVVLDTEDFDC